MKLSLLDMLTHFRKLLKQSFGSEMIDRPVLFFCIQGTIVFPLLTSVLYDESEWESPHTFNPSHFLDKEGKFIRRDAFMAFSAGKTTLQSFYSQRIAESLCSYRNDPA